ncbi:MAG: RecX family [Gaiellaceae bacterium]|nr:RecX family [Gaiellaceae bacterium]
MPVITALRERPRGRVEIDLDGAPWRLVPADAVVRASLVVGRALDREAARSLGRELRRAEALGVATRALRYRDLSRRRLEERLERRGAKAEARADALAALERAGLVDDARVASAMARSLSERGYGDAAIRFALERDGLAAELVVEALAGLEPEPDRARELAERRGQGGKTLRWLASRGFDASTLEDLAGFAEEV